VTIHSSLADFTNSVTQCERLIANAHKVDAEGNPLLPAIDQQQITVAAFLNLFIAWETFLEASLSKFMTGESTISGTPPVKYVSPPTQEHAKKITIGTMRFFDYANHENMKKIANLYFDSGYPFEPHISALYTELQDLRTMRNASAHVTSTTQTALEALATRIFGAPRPGIDLYVLLMSVDPRSPPNTVFVSYKDKLLAASSLIATG
jgi:hypothetical protein